VGTHSTTKLGGMCKKLYTVVVKIGGFWLPYRLDLRVLVQQGLSQAAIALQEPKEPALSCDSIIHGWTSALLLLTASICR
jgi:hypothetical protein